MNEQNWARWVFIWPFVCANVYAIHAGSRDGGSWFTVLYAMVVASLVALFIGAQAYYAGTLALWSTRRFVATAPTAAKVLWFSALTAGSTGVLTGVVLGAAARVDTTPDLDVTRPALIIAVIAFAATRSGTDRSGRANPTTTRVVDVRTTSGSRSRPPPIISRNGPARVTAKDCGARPRLATPFDPGSISVPQSAGCGNCLLQTG